MKSEEQLNFPPLKCSEYTSSDIKALTRLKKNTTRSNMAKELIGMYGNNKCPYYETFAVDPILVGCCTYETDQDFLESNSKELGQIYYGDFRPMCCPWLMEIDRKQKEQTNETE